MSDGRILHFFAGKGGVGKTTLAAAYAMNLAEKYPKEKVLLVSHDGSQALTDLLKKKVGPKAVRLTPGKAGGLFALEWSAAGHMPAFVDQFGPAVKKAAQKGALLSEDEVTKLLTHSLPGLEETVFLFTLLADLEEGRWDRIVVDAAPTSHLLRLVDLPSALRKYLGLVKPMPRPSKKDAPTMGGVGGFLEEVGGKVDRTLALIKDPARTAFHMVALPEPVPEAQTRSFYAKLTERGLPVAGFVVNQVEDKTGCPACQGRRGLQAPHVRKLLGVDKAVGVQLVARREEAPRGLDEVKKLGKEWATGKETRALEFSAAEGPPALVRAPSMPPITAPPIPPTRLIFFVGQGGVGKSSCAAAAAVTLTEKEGPVLLISTDPAHSLSDVLQSRLTDTETQVKGTKGLYARELDVQTWFSNLRKRWKEKAEKAFEGAAAKGADVAYDREVLRNLLDTAPTAVDELAALSTLTDAIVQERFKRIVVDPAPAGAMVRVVELPAIAIAWLEAIAGSIAKYRSKGMEELADDVAGMIKHIQRFEQALSTPAESRFLVVSRGEELAVSRTERLVAALQKRKLAVERVLVNRVLPRSTCEKCEERRKNELAAAKAMEKKIGLPITVAPALGRHPAGLRELKAFRTSWYALSAPAAKPVKAAS